MALCQRKKEQRMKKLFQKIHMPKLHMPHLNIHIPFHPIRAVKNFHLSYRARRRLKTLGVTSLVLILAGAISWSAWILWVGRYIIYTDEGAVLDFSLSPQLPEGKVATPPEKTDPVKIYYNDGSDAVDFSTELGPISGYYADSNALIHDIGTVRKQIESLPDGTAVMLDVKSITGTFYYSTKVGRLSSEVSVSAMDELISYIKSRNLYLIARIPAFKDYTFGLNNVNSGLFLPSGIGLWMDDDSCYWLDPASSITQNYLIQIIMELKSLGFREVVLTDFCFPVSDGYAYEGDKPAILTSTAANLVSSCSNSTFTVSFEAQLDSFTLPEGRTRLYLNNVSAMNVESTAEKAGVPDPTINLVFLTAAKDTRFDAYSVLRPIDSAHFDEPNQGNRPAVPQLVPGGSTSDPTTEPTVEPTAAPATQPETTKAPQ